MYTALWVNFITVMFTVPWGKCIQSSLRWCILRPEGISLHRCLEFLEGTCKCIHCSVRWCILRPEEFQTVMFTVPRGDTQIYTVLILWCILMYTVPWGNFRWWCLQCPEGTYRFILSSGLWCILMYTGPWGNFRQWCLQCPEGTYRFILSSVLWCILCPEGISDGDVYSAPREHTDLYCPQSFDVYWCILCPEGISDGDVYSAPREHTDLYCPQSYDVYCALRELQLNYVYRIQGPKGTTQLCVYITT